MQVRDFYEEQYREDINNKSRTNAYGWASILTAFKSEGEPINPNNLLPFKTKESEERERTITPQTATILARLIKDKILPPAVIASAKKLPEVSRLLPD